MSGGHVTEEGALVLHAWEYHVMRLGDGSAEDWAAPAVFTPGLDRPIGRKYAEDGCCLWLLEWKDGAALLIAVPVDEHPRPAELYELTFPTPSSIASLQPANRLPA